jgi:uncharacterized membrane protein
LIALASLALATIAFVGTHLAMSHPFRLRLVRNLGEAGFALAYSLVAFATLGWMILAYGANHVAPLWIAPLWWWNVASAIMLFASILLVGSLIGNPAFPRPGKPQPKIKAPAGVFAITRHPMNWSFMLWALVHVSVWGSLRNLIVASGILVLAFVGSIGQDRKKLATLGTAWREWIDKTSFVPFGALVTGRITWRAASPGWIALLGGLALWLAVTWFHAPLASPIGGLGRSFG